MNKFLISACVVGSTLCTAMAVCAEPSPNTLTQAQRRSGWQLLFDGKTTDGWRNYQSDKVSSGWKVVDGTLVAGKGAGDLISSDKYGNFDLSIDYRISEGGNSGVLFHVNEDGKKAWHSGPEVQLLDNQLPAAQKSGWLYELYKPVVPAWSVRARNSAGIPTSPEVDATRPAGQWNQLYLRVTDQQCEVVLNGVGYYRFRKGDDDWNERVAKSKFAKFANFGIANTGHVCLQEHGSPVAFRNIKIRKLERDGSVREQPIDGRLPLAGQLAFPDLEWEDWEPVDEDGRNKPLRIMELTHAGDTMLYAAAQRGRVYQFENDQNVQQATLLLDITDRVADWTKNNEEGLLGLAFHPDFSTNGEFYVYYSSRENKRTSVISRFVAKPNTNERVDPATEQILLVIEQPFSNHNGGSLAFGPDGYLYVGMGDGGDRNDPFGNGQDLSTLLGSILRIDVSQRDADRPYSIPADNPFIDVPGARGEIFAYGVRNVWRMAFDRDTGELWAADVGQDLWEEINIIKRGGNYGWAIREASHPFGNEKPPGQHRSAIDPIWEYDHRIGKSITGGRVYRSPRLPELAGAYLYADYVTGRIWALQRDGEVIRNMEISAGGIPVLSFGEDADGDIYYMTAAPNGKCIFRLEPK